MPLRHVVILTFDGVQALDAVGPHEIFTSAHRVLAHAGSRDGYRVDVVAGRAGRVATESGLGLHAIGLDDLDATDPDLLVVPGGDGVHRAADDPRLVDWLGSARPRRLATVCTGAFLAAAAGLLDGRRVTTHWAHAGELAARYPRLTVDPEPVYIQDGPVWSSAGVTAGMDLSLALVRKDVGVQTAQTVARWLVMFLHRPGNQSQFAAPVWIQRARDDAVRAAQDRIDGSPGGDHRVGVLADAASMSERHFQRRFVEQVGMTPGRYVAEIRVEAARRALEESTDPIRAIAARTGFGTAESMRRAFLRRLGSPPDHYRRTFGHIPTEEEVQS
ncbi:GlxA family transcriptional regulator [Rhodococcus sp. NPDC059234]|uniref:GlxA family transcriptional regulator n=1 Tax=Rhodococcus sp. NPDC059234 TaxID=3346781 RepID=UPI00366C744C